MVLFILGFIINIPEINIVWFSEILQLQCLLYIVNSYFTAILAVILKKNGCLLFFRLWNGSTASIKHKFDAKSTILAILWHKTRQNSWFGYTLAAILDFCQTGSCTTCTPCENQTRSCVDWYPQVSWNPHKVQFSSDIELVAPKLHFHNKFLSKNNTFSELDFMILSPLRKL